MNQISKKSNQSKTSQQKEMHFQDKQDRMHIGMRFSATTALNKAYFKGHATVSTIQKPFISQYTQKSQSNMDQQIANLCHYKPPKQIPKIAATIQALTYRRRQKHLAHLDNFLKRQLSFKDQAKGAFISCYNGIKTFLAQDKNETTIILQQYTDEYLLSRQKDFLTQANQLIQLHKSFRRTKFVQFQQDLIKISDQKRKIISDKFDGLRQALIQIAFILQPQADKLVIQKKQLLINNFTDISEEYNKLKEQLKIQNQQVIQETDRKFQTICNRWKQLHHNQIISEVQTQLLSNQYHYDQRIQSLILQLNDMLLKGHQFHQKIVKDLFSTQPLPSQVNNLLNDAIILNNKVQQQYDFLFQKIVKQLKLIDQKCQARLNKFQQSLIYASFKNQQQINNIVQQLRIKVKQIRDDQSTRIKAGLTWAQKYDLKGMDVLNAIGKFIGNIAITKSDQLKNYQQLVKSYQIQKAKLQDEDQQRIDNLNEKLSNQKKKLRQSLHHIKLDQNLEPCYSFVDQLQQAVRKFHSQNQKLVQKHPDILKQFFKKCQGQIAAYFQLYDQSQREKIISRKKAQAQAQILLRIEWEQKKKLQEQQQLAQQTKKKGGKAPPPPKAKDPKKAAQQLEERKQTLLKQSNYDKIQTKQGSKTWLVGLTMIQQVRKFFKGQENDQKPKEQQKYNPDKDKPDLDYVQNPPNNIEGKPLFSKNILFTLVNIQQQISNKLDILMSNLQKYFDKISNDTSSQDRKFLQSSILQLDRRLKDNHLLKGQIENNIYQPRSIQIHSHKKKYQRHVRRVNQAIDIQTQQFNFYLQQCMKLLKQFNADMKSFKQGLATAKNLPALNILNTQKKATINTLTMKLTQYIKTLKKLQSQDPQNLINDNQTFINQCKMIQSGGQYSLQQIDWYKQMMSQLGQVLQQQITKRKQKSVQIEEYYKKRKQQNDQAFNKDFAIYLQQLAARDGNGKKYAKPKRVAQQKIRVEMDKCQKAQQYLKHLLRQIKSLCQSHKSKKFNFQIRQVLIAFRLCASRYGRHLQAFKTDSKVQQLPKMSYEQDKFQIGLLANKTDQYNIRIQKQLQKIGPLSKQKEQLKFIAAMGQMQKSIKQQAQKIYVGDKAKFLTGTDKIPDWLRQFISQVKKNYQTFRQQSIRSLRQLCYQLNEYTVQLGRILMQYIAKQLTIQKTKSLQILFNRFKQLTQKIEQQKSINLKLLRPNLRNPVCRQQLQNLQKRQSDRRQSALISIQKIQKQFYQTNFNSDVQFFKYFLNNFQFLTTYFQCLLLKQDFVKLPGDVQFQKKHMDLIDILRSKQQGIVIDNTSQRLQIITFQGFLINTFDIGQEHKTQYSKQAAAQQPAKDKKGAKKESKDKAPIHQQNKGLTKQIKVFRAQRQLIIYKLRNNMFQQYKQKSNKQRDGIKNSLEVQKSKQIGFEDKWQRSVQDLLKNK